MNSEALLTTLEKDPDNLEEQNEAASFAAATTVDYHTDDNNNHHKKFPVVKPQSEDKKWNQAEGLTVKEKVIYIINHILCLYRIFKYDLHYLYLKFSDQELFINSFKG